MYGFIDTTESAKSTLMSIQTIFNGFNLDDLLTDGDGSFTTLTVTGRSDIHQKINTISVPGKDGVHEEGNPTLDPRELVVKCKVSDKSNEGIRDRFNRLNGLLSGSKRRLEFTDEDATYYATLSELEIPEEDSNDLVITIIFLCSDPYKYGTEQTLTFPADIVTVENKGTAEADPIFELIAKEKSTFAMISSGGDEDSAYNLIGRPADVDERLVDEKTQELYENGDSIDEWQESSDSKGSFIKGSQGIQVHSYGTGSEWHGPIAMREIEPLQDFEIEMFVHVRTERPNQTFRVSTNIFDEYMNELGMLRLWDKSTSQIRKVAEARVGPYLTQYENYLISDRNYNIRDQRVWNGILRITRKYNIITFYVARINQQGNHVDTLTQAYVDNINEYAGKLKFIRIDIETYGSTGIANEVGINSIRAYRHNQISVDQTPYILYPGDVVTFDHKNDDILINGEPRNDLKNFGGSFFKLKEGDNRLIVTPEDTFDSRVTYANKFR